MCCVDFIIKYVLFAANLVFTLAGIALIGVGIAALVQLNEVTDLIPVAINGIPISVIVLGSIVFAIAFFGCCGSIKESRCLLGMYAACMAVLAAGKIYLVVVIFKGLNGIQETVTEWLVKAFYDENLQSGFQALESLFSCCGTTGPESYLGVLPALPPTCCGYTDGQQQCLAENAFGGCTTKLADWFNSFGGAIGYSFIVVICIELVAMVFALVLCWFITDKRSRQRYY